MVGLPSMLDNIDRRCSLFRQQQPFACVDDNALLGGAGGPLPLCSITSRASLAVASEADAANDCASKAFCLDTNGRKAIFLNPLVTVAKPILPFPRRPKMSAAPRGHANRYYQ